MMKKITCFKAYDVRGRVPEELDDDIAYRIGRAYAAFLQPRTVAVGRDIRGSSPGLATALTKVLAPYFRTPQGGADTAVYLATSPEVRETTGA